MKAILKIKNGKAALPKDCKKVITTSLPDRYFKIPQGVLSPLRENYLYCTVNLMDGTNISIMYEAYSREEKFSKDQEQLGFKHTFTLN